MLLFDSPNQEATLKSNVIDEKQAAKYLGISLSKLRQVRLYGQGIHQMHCPPFLQLGRNIRYRIADLDRWLDEQTKNEVSKKNLA